jgi:hypothetical protein
MPEDVTETARSPTAAALSMVNVAVIWVVLTTVVLLAVTSVPLTLTAAPVAKFVPVSVTPTTCP